MNVSEQIQEACHACGLDSPLHSLRSCAGGNTSSVYAILLANGDTYAAKVSQHSDRLEEEVRGIRRLRKTNTVRVPSVIGRHNGVLILEYLTSDDTARSGHWITFGQTLAQLHAGDAGSAYGLDHDNHLGNTRQANTWSTDWIEFNQQSRFLPLVDQIEAQGTIQSHERVLIDTFITQLERMLPADPHPALIHGDLWSGNALVCFDGEVALIDPAVSIGDGLADIAMMRLFGGFPRECIGAYSESLGIDLQCSRIQTRVSAYSVYHLMNHWLLFGRGYADESLRVIQSLVT